MRFPIHLGMVLFLTLRISKAGVLPPSPDEVEIDFFDDPASTISSVDGGDDHITDDMLMAAVPAAEPQVDAQKSAIDDETSSGSTHWYAIDHCDKNSGCKDGYRCNTCQFLMGNKFYRCAATNDGQCLPDVEDAFNCYC